MDLECEERLSESPLVQRVWRSTSEQAGAFISMADTPWSMVITRVRGSTILTVRGPETRATRAYTPADAEFVGIQFKPGTLLATFPPATVSDRRDVNLPDAGSRRFWLHGAAWQFPDYENAEGFVDRLARECLLLYDPIAAAVLRGQPVRTSARTLQRRFLQATGLTRGTVAQIERARQAVALLKQGVPILDTVEGAGYYDQPHLTRALKRYAGQTPAQIADPNRSERLSFLYKTVPTS